MTSIKLLEDRITELERQVYGLGKVLQLYGPLPETSVVDSLLHANTLISSALSGREKISVAIKRLPELNKYLDVTCDEVDVLPIDVKLQLLLALEPEIKENHKNLMKVQELMPALETDYVRDVPELSAKLNELTIAHLKTQEESEQFSSNMYELFSKYNDVITSISKALITLDGIITRAEVAHMPKKQID